MDLMDQDGGLPSSLLTKLMEGITFNPLPQVSMTASQNTPTDFEIKNDFTDFDSNNNSSANVTVEYEIESIEFSLMFQVCVYILYNVVFVSAVLGNILVIYVVASSVRMRTVTNYLIANLALGDLLMALLCVPFSYLPVLLQYWPFGLFLCHLVSPAQATCVFVSAYTLVALAIDRYLAILYPLRPRLRRSQALIVIALVWLVALVTAAPIALFTRLKIDGDRGLPLCEESGWEDDEMKLAYSLTLMVLQYFFPISVLIYTYTRIALAVWGKKAPGEAENVRDQRLAKAKRKIIKMMLTVVIVYTVCWLPFNTLLVTSEVKPEWIFYGGNLIAHIYFLSHWLAVAHTVCNPIIYCWMNSRFRAGFRSAISNIPCLTRLLQQQLDSPSAELSHHLHHQRGYYLGFNSVANTRLGGEGRLTRANTTCTTYTFTNGANGVNVGACGNKLSPGNSCRYVGVGQPNTNNHSQRGASNCRELKVCAHCIGSGCGSRKTPRNTTQFESESFL